ncbi:MAG: iduronate-2-sulfatase [Gemmataceae bacterium]
MRVLMAIAVTALGLLPACAAEKLNVLLVVSDDLCNRLGCYGDTRAQSPHVDRLARRGVRFDRAYCQYPLCNPSRASFLTGRRPDTTRVQDNSLHFRKTLGDIVTLPQAFRQAGYFVARVGKLYHYGVPGDIGTNGLDDAPSWDRVVNPRGRDRDDEDQIFTLRPDLQGPARFGGVLSWLAAEGTDDEQTDAKGAAAAIELLEQNRDRPFFLAVGFYRPHTPFVAPKAYFAKHPLEHIQLPQVPQKHRQTAPPLAFASARPEQDKMTDELRRQAIQAYYASVSFMDAQLGRLLDALDRLDLTRRTIVVFTSDHGYHLGEHGLWQKMSLFENSARVPLIISVPGTRAGGRPCTRTVELVDLYPTLVDLCGLPVPKGLEGTSLRPLLNDPEAPWDKPAFTQVVHRGVRGRTVRTERYRYTEWDDGLQGAQLYDYATDPKETVNRAADPKYAEVVISMRRLLQRRTDP